MVIVRGMPVTDNAPKPQGSRGNERTMEMVPRHHEFLTAARNHISEAACEIEQSWFDNKDPAYKKLHEATSRLLDRYAKLCDRNYRRGKKEGWFNGHS